MADPFDRRRKPFETAYSKRIRKELERYGASVALQIKDGVSPYTYLLSGQFLSRSHMDKTLRDLWNKTGEYFIGYSNRSLRRMGLNVQKPTTWGQSVEQYWANEGFNKVNTIVANKEDNIRRVISSTIEQAQKEGEGIVKISEKITKALTDNNYKTTAKFDAIRIARTEVAAASNTANAEQIYSIDGGYKVWMTVGDSAVRGDHAALHGYALPNRRGETFPFVEMAHPHDPKGKPSQVINCRCKLIWQPEK